MHKLDLRDDIFQSPHDLDTNESNINITKSFDYFQNLLR